MRINLNGHRIGLEHGRTLSFRANAGTTIKALRGELWVTQDGDRNDYLLCRGDQIVLKGNAPVVIQAESDADLAIYERPTLHPWARLIEWLSVTLGARRPAS